MIYIRTTLMIGTLLIGTGCSAKDPAQPDPNMPPVTTRLFYGDCVRLTEEEQAKGALIPAIAAVVLPSLISSRCPAFIPSPAPRFM